MKIFIAGSMYFAKKMLGYKKKLEEMGYIVTVTDDVLDCIKKPDLNMDLEHCLKTNVQEKCFDKVSKSNAILVLNYERNGIKGYIGAATLMEMGLAQHLKKKIFLLYPPPKVEELRYSIEIQATKPIILNGNLSRIS